MIKEQSTKPERSRGEGIYIHISAEQKAEFKQAASDNAMTMTAWLTVAGREKLKRDKM